MCNENNPTKASEAVTWAKIDQLICSAIRSDLTSDVQRELGKLVNLIKPIKDLELKDEALKMNAKENKDQPADSETQSGSGHDDQLWRLGYRISHEASIEAYYEKMI